MKDQVTRVAGRSLISLTLRGYYNDILRSSSSKLNKPIPVILSDMEMSLDFVNIYTQYKKYVMLINDRTIDMKFTSGELVLSMSKSTHSNTNYSGVRFPLQLVTLDRSGTSKLLTIHLYDVYAAWDAAAKLGLITRLSLNNILTSARYIQELFLGLALIKLDDTLVDSNTIGILQRNFTLGKGLFIIGSVEQSKLNGESYTNNYLKYTALEASCNLFAELIKCDWVAATYDNEI